MYKKTGAILAAGLLLGLAGCGKSETPPLSGQDQIYEDSMNAGLAKVRSNPELKRLQTLREAPSVINASIKNTLSNNSPAAEYYTINLRVPLLPSRPLMGTLKNICWIKSRLMGWNACSQNMHLLSMKTSPTGLQVIITAP